MLDKSYPTTISTTSVWDGKGVGIQAIAGHAVDVPNAGAQKSAPLTDRFSHRRSNSGRWHGSVNANARLHPLVLAGCFLITDISIGTPPANGRYPTNG